MVGASLGEEGCKALVEDGRGAGASLDEDGCGTSFDSIDSTVEVAGVEWRLDSVAWWAGDGGEECETVCEGAAATAAVTFGCGSSSNEVEGASTAAGVGCSS